MGSAWASSLSRYPVVPTGYLFLCQVTIFIARVICAIWITRRVDFHLSFSLWLLATTNFFTVVGRSEYLFCFFFIRSFCLLRELHICFFFVYVHISALHSAGIVKVAKRREKNIKHMDP